MNLLTMFRMLDTKLFLAANSILATLDVGEMLKGEGAAGEGGALKSVKDLVTNYGQGGYSIFRNLSVYAAAISLAVFFISLMINSGNASKRAEKKDSVPALTIGSIGVFAISVIVTLAQTIGSKLG